MRAAHHLATAMATGALCTALMAACGGGGSAPPVRAAQVELTRLHFILRPDSAGRWYIQNDADHAPFGMVPTVEQGADYVRVFFDRTYTKAGVIGCASDDDFRDRVAGYSNLGLNNATIRIVAGGRVIDPATVASFVPPGSGNLWCSVTMQS